MGKLPGHIISLISFLVLTSCSGDLSQTTLFEDGFNQLSTGYLSAESTSSSEYYYFPGTGQKGNWTVTSFGQMPGNHESWEISESGGDFFLIQNITNPGKLKREGASMHPPMIIAGDKNWTNYTVRFSFKPFDLHERCGVMFRYQNDRCYYYFGMEGNMLMLKMVQQATAPYRPFEKVLDARKFNWVAGQEYRGLVTLRDDKLFAQINDSILLNAVDSTYKSGKIGLLSDNRVEFHSVEVTTLKSEKRKLNRKRLELSNRTAVRLIENPEAVLMKTISTAGFGAGRNLRFGDLNGDGESDILIGQGKRLLTGEVGAEITCLTAVNLEGDILWQFGSPNKSNQLLNFDLPFQIHDIDGDGAREVIYSTRNTIRVIKGESGKIIKEILIPGNLHPRRVGDLMERSIYFCDLEGKGRDSDLLLVDKNGWVQAFDDRFRPLWQIKLVAASFPAAEDIDGDGKDEIVTAYSLIDDDGTLIWDLNDKLGSEVNSVAISQVITPIDTSYSILISAGEWGLIILDLSGNVIGHQLVGNVRKSSIANYHNDMDGLEIIAGSFSGNQGIINFLSYEGSLYRSFEPGTYGCMCAPVNWKGDGEEYILLNTSPGDGGLFNGSGQYSVAFPDDGHPTLCSFALDISGDVRDEIITWDQDQIWIYTQLDNPRKGKIYNPRRNPIYNYSINQSIISIPDWD